MNRSFLTLVSVLVPVSVLAQVPSISAVEIIDQCLLEVDNGGDIARFAEDLVDMSSLTLAPEDRWRGMACLREHFGERYYFDTQNQSFISETDSRSASMAEREAQEAIERVQVEAAALQAERRYDYTRRLLDACYAKLEEDAFEALTEPLCAQIFELRGFPDE